MSEGSVFKGVPKARVKSYDKQLVGVIGRMGAKDTSVSYVQVNLPVSDLALLGLVSEIPGSEKWPIRQLFQRDIDSERVGKDIIPYFLDSAMTKFFNPLTIAVLPINSLGSFASDNSEVECEPNSDTEFGRAFALESFYRVSFDVDGPWALVEWNSSNVKLIAIDGQHRLAALKRIYGMYQKDPADKRIVASDFSNWVIPIVLVTVGHKDAKDSNSGALLERTRNIFVTINKQAKPPSRTRTILLNDFSVLAVACQEVLDCCAAHGASLALFNWREYKDEDRPGVSTFLMTVDELEDILKEYMLGEDSESHFGLELSQDQREALFWKDANYSLTNLNDAGEIRSLIKKRFGETVLPAFFFILREISPYSDYIKFIARLESSFDSDIQKHAWSRLVYGSDYAPGIVESEVSKEKIAILESCKKEQEKLGSIFGNAIGHRGVYSGFGQYYEILSAAVCVEPWLESSMKFVAQFNKLYEKGLFTEKKMPPHITHDHLGTVVNYKHEVVPKALGAYVAYSCLYSSEYWERVDLSEMRDALMRTLISGFKREHRKKVKDELAGQLQSTINEAILVLAQESAGVEMAKLERRLKACRPQVG